MRLINRLPFGVIPFMCFVGCSSMPTPEHKSYRYPTGKAFVEAVKRPYRVIGMVRAKVNFPTLDPMHEESDLCKNYYFKAVKDLVSSASEKEADAVLEVRSVVFLADGRKEVYSTPECSDDGLEGQILVQGLAVQWEKPQEEDLKKSKMTKLAPLKPKS